MCQIREAQDLLVFLKYDRGPYELSAVSEHWFKTEMSKRLADSSEDLLDQRHYDCPRAQSKMAFPNHERRCLQLPNTETHESAIPLHCGHVIQSTRRMS